MSLKPVVRAEEPEEEEDLVDPLVKLKDECSAKPSCASLKERLETCNDRVRSKTATTETCVEEMLDFVHCVDHCVAKDLFKHVK
jgi:ubiquinol-cytochrome c reductase subunit 6